MSRVIITAAAMNGLACCEEFLYQKNYEALQRAGLAISKQFLLLETFPEIGRPLDDIVEIRELLIPFGDSGYVALYRYEADKDEVYVLALRHQKEAGYF